MRAERGATQDLSQDLEPLRRYIYVYIYIYIYIYILYIHIYAAYWLWPVHGPTSHIYKFLPRALPPGYNVQLSSADGSIGQSAKIKGENLRMKLVWKKTRFSDAYMSFTAQDFTSAALEDSSTTSPFRA